METMVTDPESGKRVPLDKLKAAKKAAPKADRKPAGAPKGKKAAAPKTARKERHKADGPLVCRYCGSDDLAPSFIKRRDRRCRKCFSKRYGSAARARKAKVKKKFEHHFEPGAGLE